MRVVVILATGTVVVDELSLQIAANKFPRPENINGAPASKASVISWDGERMFGTIQSGDPFRDPAVIRPYVRVWSDMVADMVEAVGKAIDAEEAAYAAIVEAEKKADKERARVAALSDEDRAREAAAGPG